MNVNQIKGDFLVPDYYKKFSCKGSNCINSCCKGWNITIPMQQYFLLHGLNVGKKLREKLDKTFRVLPVPTKDRYAEIAHDISGDCLMHMDDGYCFLHKKLGEESLPSVCRYYPRGPRISPVYEASTSNSCERTLELLLENDDIIQYEMIPLKFKMPFKNTFYTDSDIELYKNVRTLTFRILSDRKYSLSDRLMKIGSLMQELDLGNVECLSNIDIDVTKTKFDILENFTSIKEMLLWIANNKPRISEDIMHSLDNYSNINIIDEYCLAKNNFTRLFPNYDIMFEKLLINNLFFRQFPFNNDIKSFYDEFLAVAGTYVFIKFLSMNLMKNQEKLDDFINLMSRLFRIIAHTGFEKNIVYLLKKMSLDSIDRIKHLISL